MMAAAAAMVRDSQILQKKSHFAICGNHLNYGIYVYNPACYN